MSATMRPAAQDVQKLIPQESAVSKASLLYLPSSFVEARGAWFCLTYACCMIVLHPALRFLFNPAVIEQLISSICHAITHVL